MATDSKFEILNPDGIRVGELAMTLHDRGDADALDKRFQMFPGGLSFLLKQIRRSEIFPIAEFADLTIRGTQRKRGFGRDAMRAFNACAVDRGAKLGLLNVATQGEEYSSGLEWRSRFYASEGWRDFEELPKREYLPHWMFHLFEACNPPTRDVASILRELDELTEWFRVVRSSSPSIPPEPRTEG